MTVLETVLNLNLTKKLEAKSNSSVRYNLFSISSSQDNQPTVLNHHHELTSKRYCKGPPPKSCDLCKRWKVKCDRTPPKCSTCKKNGTDCTYNYASKYWEHKNKSKPPRALPLGLSTIRISNLSCDYQFPTPNLDTGYNSVPNSINQLLETMSKRNSSLKHSIAKSFLKLHPNLAPILSEHISEIALSGSLSGSSSASQEYKLLLKLKESIFDELGQERTRMIQIQLVGYYFKYLNAFYPLIDEEEFMLQLEHQRHDAPFTALLNVVCMIGLGYSTTPELTSKLAPALGFRARSCLRQCYNKPSLTTIQACIILSHYCNTDEDDGIIQSSWFFLGMAQQMALQLGLNIYNSRRSAKDQLLCWRVWCILAVDDILIEHCIGLPASLSVEVGFLPPQYVSPPSELTDHNPSFRFLRIVMIHYRLLPFVARLRSRFDRVAQTPALTRVMNPPAKTGTNFLIDPEFNQFQKMTLSLENLYHQWYQFIPDFTVCNLQWGSSCRQHITTSNPSDQYSGLLMVFYFATLVEMYRPLILPDLPLARYQLVLERGHVSISDFTHFNPLEKAATAAHFGVLLFQQSGFLLADLGHPYMWYCIMNLTFIHIYLLSCHPPPHPVAAFTRAQLTYLAALTQYGAQKCAIVRDLFHTLDPLLRAYRTN